MKGMKDMKEKPPKAELHVLHGESLFLLTSTNYFHLRGNMRLSVIITSYNSETTIEKCLKSLEHQDTEHNFEIIVVDSSTDGTAELVRKKFPNIKLYTFNERKYCGGARNFGVSKANGEIAAFIDADCTASRNWVNEILKAHQSSQPAIGGAVANGNPGSYVGWGGYFCELSHIMHGGRQKQMTDIGGGCMSYKKYIFEKYGGFIEGTYCSDSEFHWRLQKNGINLLFVPSIILYHRNIENLLVYLKHEFIHGKSFARVRTKYQNFSNKKRNVYIFLSFLIPLVLLIRITINTVKNRTYLGHFIISLPLLIPGLITWSSGECAGYIRQN